MKGLAKKLCIILSLLLLFPFLSSCSSEDLTFNEDVSDTIPESNSDDTEASSESNSDDTEASSESLPEVDANPFSDLTMACIGSSSTLPTKVERAYPTVVQNILGLREVYNYGVSWSTLAYIEDCYCHPDSDYNHDPYVFRYSDMTPADIIVVQGGGHNDWGCLIPLGDIDDTEPTTFYGALNILIEGLKKSYPDSYILFMTSFDTYNNIEATNRDGVYYCDFAEAIINVCEKYEVDCLDIYHNMPFDRDKDTVDGTHPTQEYIDQVWAPMVADFIRENYKK